jgi:hypothetical protein
MARSSDLPWITLQSLFLPSRVGEQQRMLQQQLLVPRVPAEETYDGTCGRSAAGLPTHPHARFNSGGNRLRGAGECW